jgi:tetratricopeptide (TPR) repeat protein
VKEHHKAIADYDRALTIDPKYIDAYNNRGYAYQCLKQYQRAIQDYDRALELDSNYSRARANKERASRLMRG